MSHKHYVHEIMWCGLGFQELQCLRLYSAPNYQLTVLPHWNAMGRHGTFGTHQSHCANKGQQCGIQIKNSINMTYLRGSSILSLIRKPSYNIHQFFTIFCSQVNNEHSVSCDWLVGCVLRPIDSEVI